MTQTARMRSLVTLLRKETGLPELQIFIGGSQDLLMADEEQHRMMGIQREAEGHVANDDAGVRYGFTTYDLATIDNIHQTEMSQITSGIRFAAQLIAWIEGRAQIRDPRLAGARSVDPTHMDVTIAVGSGTDIMPPSMIDGFRIETAAGIHSITAAVRQSADLIRLTHSSTNGRTATVSYALYNDTDDAHCVRGNDGLTLPMEPSYIPVITEG